MGLAMKFFDNALCRTAGLFFDGMQFISRYNPATPFTPRWSEKRMLKSWEKTKPMLGWPRETDSLCPGCVREAREAIISGEKDYKMLITEKVGEIKAKIIQRDADGSQCRWVFEAGDGFPGLD